MSYKITFSGMDNVLDKLQQVGINTIEHAFLESMRTAEELENYSKDHRPWTDRTGNARRSIYAYTDITDTTIVITHGIGVSYGKYLETSWGGKYRVIRPSVNKYRGVWINNLKFVLRSW